MYYVAIQQLVAYALRRQSSGGCTFNPDYSSSKFCVGSRVRQTPEEGRRTYQPKLRGDNNKDEDSSSKSLNDKNHQASSQKLRQLVANI